jgi:TonB family protein
MLPVLPSVTCGQQGEVAKAAQQIADAVLKQGRKRVIVADFIGPEEQINELGRSLSDQLSLALANANHGLEILPRGGSLARYTKHSGDSESSSEGAAASLLAQATGAEIVVAGDLATSSDAIHVNLRVWEITAQGKKKWKIGQANNIAELKLQASLGPEDEQTLGRVLRSESSEVFLLAAGAGRPPPNPPVPACIDCPPPRALLKEATVKLFAMVDTNGRVIGTEVTEASDQKAVKPVLETVRKWRFQAAHGPDGHPMVVRVSVVVNMRIKR